MTLLLRAWCVALALALALVSGCSTHRMAEKTRLPLHPLQETRMTNAASAGYVATGVWRVRGAQNTVYLVGTCHLVRDDEIPFPSSYYAAYRDAQDIYLEIDPLSFKTTWMLLGAVPSMVGFFAEHAADLHCPKGRTLADYLSAETVRELREIYGSSYASIEPYTPLGLVFYSELGAEPGAGEGGVDDLFALLARRDGKRIRTLDDRRAVQLVVPIFEGVLDMTRRQMAEQGVDAVVRESVLGDAKPLDGWRYGDVSAADEDVAEMKRDFPELYEQLLPERNRRWMPAIQDALQGKRNAMVLVGALHLPGEGGLLELLKQAGYQPEQMFGIDRPGEVRP